LTDDDEALTGRAFAVNPDPIGLISDGTKDPNIPEADATIDDKPKHGKPSANAAVASKTSYRASKVGGTRSDPPEVAGEIIKKKDVTKAALILTAVLTITLAVVHIAIHGCLKT
jgi:hypothetical protein